METKEVVVLGVKKVEFEKDGRSIEGTKVYFTDKDSCRSEGLGKGYLPADHWFQGTQKFEEFKEEQLPGKYKMEYGIHLDGGKPKLVIRNFTYVNSVNLG